MTVAIFSREPMRKWTLCVSMVHVYYHRYIDYRIRMYEDAHL